MQREVNRDNKAPVIKNQNANLKLEAKSKTEKTVGKVQKKVGQAKNFLGGSVMLICNNYCDAQ